MPASHVSPLAASLIRGCHPTFSSKPCNDDWFLVSILDYYRVHSHQSHPHPGKYWRFYVRHEMGLERVHHGFQNSKRERIHLDFQNTSFATTWNPFPPLVYTTCFQTVFQYRTHWAINRIFFAFSHPQTVNTTRTCLSSSHTTSINSSRQSAPNLFRSMLPIRHFSSQNNHVYSQNSGGLM